MYLYMFAKYLAYKQSDIQDYEILLEVIIYILLISLMFSFSKKVWNWLQEYHYTKQAQEQPDFYFDPVKTFNDDECPICMCKPVKEVKTNCGHIFCGLCFRQFFTVTKTGPNRYKCPLCRRTVSTLQRYNKGVNIIEGKTRDDAKIKKFLNEYHWQFNRHKLHNIKIRHILRPWITNIIIVLLILMTLISPMLYSCAKRFIFENYFAPSGQKTLEVMPSSQNMDVELPIQGL